MAAWAARVVALILFTGSAPGAWAQSFEVANPTLAGLSVDVEVRAVEGGWYEYSYVLRNAAPSTGALLGFSLDIRGSGEQKPPPSDGDGRLMGDHAAVPVLPVGFGVPADWKAGTTRLGFARWSIDGRDAEGMLLLGAMAPGSSSPPLILRSFDPPAMRDYQADPFWSSTDPATTAESSVDVQRRGQVLGPVPLDDTNLELFRGGSNNPAVVDRFLSYRVPAQKTTILGAGEKALVVVQFGPTVIPGTLRATWNGQVVTDRFAVIPGQFSAVQFDPVPGRNVLELKISGLKPSGGTGSDSDRLLWESP
jgi:hypothetical protein